MCKSLTVITVVKNPESELFSTQSSIQKIFEMHKVDTDFRWILLDGSKEEGCVVQSVKSELKIYDAFRFERIVDNGIYNAINQSLQLISTKHFMFVHSGDLLLPNVLNILEKLGEDKADCFLSFWHSIDGAKVRSRDSRRVSRFFGTMPNHQAMIFPAAFKNYCYDENLPISADQDLKLYLHRNGKLVFHSEFIVSSLEGGISSRKINFRQAASRSYETWKVLRKHFGPFHSLIVTLVYSLIFLRRILP